MAKTAVVIIHGIGEQRPMATVRSFVRFFAGQAFRSKPDKGSDFFEMRRLSTFASNEAEALAAARSEAPDYPPDTVFYEYYWAFHFRDTKIGLVTRWSFLTVRDLVSSGSFRHLRGSLKWH